MPLVATAGSLITVTTGSCQATTTVADGNTVGVTIGGVSVATVSSRVTPWLSGSPPGCVTTFGTVRFGNPSVLVGGLPITYVGAQTAAGPIASTINNATVIVGN